MLDKLRSGMSYSIIGCELKAKESVMHVKDVTEQKHTKNKICVDWLVKM